jgi:hypothetical protein
MMRVGCDAELGVVWGAAEFPPSVINQTRKGDW